MVYTSGDSSYKPKLEWGLQAKPAESKAASLLTQEALPGAAETPAGNSPMPGLPSQGSSWQGGPVKSMDFDKSFSMDALKSTGKSSLKQKSEAMAIANQLIQALKSLQPPIEPSLLEPIVDKLGKIAAKLGEQIRALEASGEKQPEANSSDAQPPTASQDPAAKPGESAQGPETKPSNPPPAAPQPAETPGETSGEVPGDKPGNEGTGYTEGKAGPEPPKTAAPKEGDNLLKMLQDKRISAQIRGMLDEQSIKQMLAWLKQSQNP